MRILPVQTKVLPGLIKGNKTLPKEIIKTASAAAGLTTGAILGSESRQTADKAGWDGCGCEDWCTPLLSF